MPSAADFLKQSQNAWKKLDSGKRSIIALTIVIFVVGTSALLYWSARPSYTVLFSNLSSEDAAAIVAKLQEDKIPYQLPSDGVVEVPADSVYETRLKLASDGLPQGGSVGFEIFDKNSLGMSEFTQKISYRRALEGELSRTISQLSEISGARVHIVIPESDLYEEKENPTTSSVVLKVKPGAMLSEKQVQGIVHLIASSVEGLKPENVNLIDTNGNILSEAGGAGAFKSGLTQFQFDAKQSYESNLEQGIESMLGKVLGVNKSVVKVSAELDFTQAETKSETFKQADEPVVSSEQSTKEKYTGQGSAPSGTGVTTYSTTQSGGTSNYNKTDKTTNYDVSKQVKEEVKPPGGVKKLSVAVFVDSKTAAKVQTSLIENAVSAAAGIDAKRGDVLTLSKVPFDTSQAEKEQQEIEAAEKGEQYQSIGKIAGIVILLALGIFALTRLLSKIKKGEGESQEMWPRPLMALEEQVSPSNGPLDKEVREEIMRLAKEKPGDMAQLLKVWLVSKD